MLSNKPYLIRAFYEWIVDSECTPYLLIDASMPRVDVPEQFVEDGQIVLNVAPEAVTDLLIKNKAVTFGARFSGVKKEIYAPIQAVLAIYAMENEQGMFFDPEELEEISDDDFDDDSGQQGSGKPHLHIVE